MDVTRELGGKLTISNKTFSIYGGINTVGRNKEATVNIKSLNVSQHHAIIILVDDDLHFISDLKSSNGTFLNGEPLAPLQLYRIKSGCHIKFADIEGTYFQCSSENTKFKSPNESQYTQTYSQSFYATNTQLIDNSFSTNQNDKTFHAPNTSYIPTQALMNVATALERNYENIHELPTQLVVNIKKSHDMSTKKVNLQANDQNSTNFMANETKNSLNQNSYSKSIGDSDQSIIDLHEAETQKVTPDEKYEILKAFGMTANGLKNESCYHEMETQLMSTIEKECEISNNTSVNSIESLRKPNINENVNISRSSPEISDIKQNHNFTADKLDSNNKEQTTNNVESHHEMESISQDSDTVKPLGISNNIIASQHLLDVNSSNTKCDMPTKLKNITPSTFESPIHEHCDNREMDDEGSNDSIDFMTMQKVVDIENDCLRKDSAVADDLSERCNTLDNQVQNNASECHLEENSVENLVKPVGLSRNLITSQNSVDENVSDTDSDVIRPVKKSSIAFHSSQESLINEHGGSGEILDEDTNDSLDFMTMQKVVSMEKNNVKKNDIKGNEINDNITDSPTYVNKTKEDKDNSKISASVYNATKNQYKGASDSETDIENEMIEKKYSQKVDSETDIENDKTEERDSQTEDGKLKKGKLSITNEHQNESSINERKLMMEKHKTETSSYSSKELDEISDGKSDADKQTRKKDSLPIKQKNKMKIRRKKRNNIMVDSETDSEVDIDIADGNVINSYKKNDEIGDTEERKDTKEVINTSNLSEQYEVKLIDETRTEENILNSSVEPKVNLNNLSDNIEGGKERKIILSINESLNDSDIIPATQEVAPIRSISQNSKFENSEESFKLGLTQLMEDNENDNSQNKPGSQNAMAKMNTNISTENLKNDVSENSQKTQKKFVFKKKDFSNTSERANITLNDADDEIYEAKTQNLCEEPVDSTTTVDDDHVFLEPTQKLRKKSINPEKCIPDDEIYNLCTQRMDGSLNKNNIDDIYLQSTQKLSSENFNSHLEEKNKVSPISKNSIQCQESCKNNTETSEYISDEFSNQDDDLNDMFATQTMIPKTTPKKSLERELEFMFATQKALPTEESLDKIKDVIFQTPIDNSKLPEEDSDLEAILATQKYLDSPKTSKPHEKTETSKAITRRSIESQLEVLFCSQPNNLPTEKVSRPVNPLVNILGKDTQETEPVLSEINSTEASETVYDEMSSVVKNLHSEDKTRSSRLKNRINSQNAVEQSFALLEAKSTRIRRSARNANCEEVTVTCPKSRNSMIIAPNEKFENVLELEGKLTKEKKKRAAIKRQSPTSSDLSNQTKEVKHEEINKKKRKVSKSSISESVACSNKLSISSTLTRSKRTSKLIATIEEDKDDDFEIEEIPVQKSTHKPEHKKVSDAILNNKRSSRTNRNNALTEENSDINCKDKVTRSLNVISEKRETTFSDGQSENNSVEKAGQKIPSNENNQKLTTSELNSSASNNNKCDVSSRTSKRRCEIVVSTPSKSRKKAPAITPSTRQSVLEFQDSPSRNKRKQRIKVVFTMIKDPKLESVIKLLGGTVQDSVDTCTVLITPSIKRSMKLLSAVGLGKPICSVKWIEDSKKKNQFLDPWDYLLIDDEAETKWDFSLKVSLERSLQAKLFEGFSFQLMVKTALDVLKGAIEYCGGKIVTRTPKETKHFFVVASTEQEDKYKKLLKQQPHLKVIEPEAIFDGVLRQEIRFEKHLLNI